MAEERIVVYTLGECPACEKLRASYHAGGIPFEERRVDQDQRWLDEALRLADMVPIIVHPSGKVEVGVEGEMG